MGFRIKYWYQETQESGRWCVSGLTTLAAAKKVIAANLYDQAYIVLDEDGFPEWNEEADAMANQ